MRFVPLFAVLLALACAGCMSPQAPTQTYAQAANGAVAPTVRAAMDPRTDPGPQEIIGINIPGQPFGIPFAVKAGLLYDGSPLVITWPQQPQAAYAPQGCYQAAPQGCAQSVLMIPQTQYVPQQTMTPYVLTPAAVPAPQAVAPCR